MADDNIQLTRAIANAVSGLDSAAKSLGKASDNLSNVGVDNLLKILKNELKQRELLTDAHVDAIKDVRQMEAALETLNKQLKEVNKIYDEHEDEVEKTIKLNKLSNAMAEQFRSKQKSILEDKLKEAKFTAQHAEALRKGVPNLNAFIISTGKATANLDGMNKGVEKVTKSLSESAKKFVSLGTAMALTRKAFLANYDQLNRLATRGMIGAWKQLNIGAFRLYTSVEKLEDIINKNRDIVAQLGGGGRGVSGFVDMLSEARKDLEFLGVGATEAAAQFAEMTKKGGFGANSLAFADNMKAATKQFKLFNGLFGDTAEQYAQLFVALQDEEQQRNKLNALTEKGRTLELAELRARTENMKLLGMSNQQIVDFNRRVGETLNPQKSGQIATRAKEALSTRAGVNTLARTLMGGDADDRSAAANLQASSSAINALITAHGRGDAEGFKKIGATDEGRAAMAAISNARSRMNLRGQFQREFSNQLFDQGGALSTELGTSGAQQAAADAANQNLKKLMSPEQLRDTIKSAIEGADSAEAKALASAAKAMETFSNLISNPLAIAVTALASIVGTFMMFGNKIMGLFGMGAPSGAAAATGGSAAARMLGGGILGNLLRFGGVGAGAMLHSGETGGTTDLEKELYNRSRGSGAASSGSTGSGMKLHPRVQGLMSSINQHAARTGVDANVLAGMIQQESGGRSDAVSHAGARGVAQFMPATAKRFGVDVNDPNDSVRGMSDYMAVLLKRYNGNYSKAMAAYNAGEGNVDKAIKRGGANWFQNLPSETRNYVPAIMKNVSAANSGASVYATSSGGSVGPSNFATETQAQASTVGSFTDSVEMNKQLLLTMQQVAINTSKRMPAPPASAYPSSMSTVMNGG